LVLQDRNKGPSTAQHNSLVFLARTLLGYQQQHAHQPLGAQPTRDASLPRNNLPISHAAHTPVKVCALLRHVCLGLYQLLQLV
jgi:hypothetical protein